MEHLTSDLPKIKEESPEERARKSLARKRIFWTVVGLDVVLALLILFSIIDMFIR